MVEILKLMLGIESEDEILSRLMFELVIRTQSSGPLCLWQCFLIILSFPSYVWKFTKEEKARVTCQLGRGAKRATIWSPGNKQQMILLDTIKLRQLLMKLIFF